MRKMQVKLKNGMVVVGDYFDDEDYEKIKTIFQKWLEINGNLKALGGRTLNVPDVVSEALYCYFYNAIRTNGNESGAGSYDAVDIADGSGVQVKSTSIKEDLTSFGPHSTWDKLFFLDFCPNGTVDGQVDVYEIKDDVKGIILNASKGETFADQQAQGRRPRFSIKKEIIQKNGYKPDKTINLV